MVTGYVVSEDGTLQEMELTKESLDSGQVVCVVDDETKSIYLWKGSQAGVRKKFIGARVATNLRSEYGFNFKVRPVDEGEEPPTFFSALDGTTAAVRVMKPGEAAPPPTPPKAEPAEAAAPAEAVAEPKPAAPSPKPAESKAKPIPAAPKPPPAAKPAAPAPVVTTAPVSQDVLDTMIKELEGTDPPEGYQRELLIVYNELYTVAEHRRVVFGQETVERKFEKVKDPPEGSFMAEGFIPRVIVKEGRVLGIELLKGTPDAILSPIKAEMRERLTDLISFFRSEIDTGETTPEPKKPRKTKKKLVAK
ncbi:MAG: hypothetical protein JSW61_11270 [Candidatus Thorarchaeota archaeon]|nr:MAG: hypothetical protein JSW61_11270 [Candidatus Thorarchaeota archaeon]